MKVLPSKRWRRNGKVSGAASGLERGKYDSKKRLENILSNQLPQWELKYGNGVDENTLSTRFSGVIRRASEQAGCGVVVLVDEYDTLAASPRQ